MPKIQFQGRVSPAGAACNISGLPTAHWPHTELGLEMTFTFTIEQGVVVIDCELNKWNRKQHYIHAYMRALDMIRAAVDLCVFSTGIGMTVVLETLIEPDGTKSTLQFYEPKLPIISTAVRNDSEPQSLEDNNYVKVFAQVFANDAARRALRDLAETVSETHIAPVACGRAMEGIRNVIAPLPEKKKAQAWAKMNEALRIDRSYIDLIKDTSTGPRHGDPTHIPGPICMEITERSWIIMNRFFEYLKRGSQPLPESEFPTLR